MTRTARNGLFAAVVVVVLVGLVGLGWLLRSGGDSAAVDPSSAPSSAGAGEGSTPSGASSAPGGEVDVAAARVDEFGLGIGDPQAPVKVEVFEDFQCPHCQAFEQAATDDLRAAAGDGSAFVVYRPMAFLNEWSARSMNAFGVVLETAGGEVALRFHDLLFANQPAGVAPSDDEIVAMAVEAGAVEDEVRGGIEGADFADWVADATDAASERGVTGTPTVFVDGEVVTGATIEQVLENTLAGIEAG